MKWYQRALSGVLTAAMSFSLAGGIPTASAAAPMNTVLVSSSSADAAGEILAVIQLDYPIYEKKLDGSTVKLYRDSEVLASGSLQDASLTFTGSDSTASATITKQYTGSQVSSVEIRMTGLSAESGSNQYRLELTGNGFKTYRSDILTLSDYSLGLVLGTGTFTLGDLNHDGAVNSADVEAVKAKLGTADSLADLNGDGAVDISDLAIVTMGAATSGEAKLYHTAAITANLVNSTAVAEALESEPSISEVVGKTEDLFTDNGSAVTIKPLADAETLQLPIPLADDGIVMEQVEITSSAGSPVEKGTLKVETTNGQILSIPFGEDIPDGVHAIQVRDTGRKVVTISLGKRVPVKSITIQVDLDEAGKEVVVEQIQFLQDVLPENPVSEDTQIKNVTAQAGNKEVTLSWDVYPNITGYKIYYGTNSAQLSSTVETEKTTFTVTGLENLKTYYFAVAPVSTAGGQTWEGTKSAVVHAVPQPSSVPDKPDSVTVTAGDKVLMVTWKPGKDTKYSKVQYRLQGESSFIVLDGQYTSSAAITGLTNGETYEVQVFGVNDKGSGPVSLTAIGTPKPEVIEAPDLPTANRLDNSVIVSASYPTGNTDTSVSKGTLPGAVYDGDFQTGWVASTYQRERKFTFTFDQAYEMDYLIYVPNLGRDTQKNDGRRYRDYFTSFNLWINGEKVAASDVSYESARDNQYFIIKFPKATVTSISVEGSQWDGAGNISLSEVAFYQYDGLADQISALFANDSHTALAGGVDAERISALREKAASADAYYVDRAVMLDELANAQQLLENKQDELIIRDGFTSRSISADNSQYGQYASVLQPLGISALSKQYITLYVEGLGVDETMKLVQWQQYSEATATAKSYTLHNGRNRIYLSEIGNSGSGERGGALYVEYAGSNASRIKIQVRDTSENKSVVTVIPMLNISSSQWYGKSETERKSLIRTYVTELQQYVATLSFPNDTSRRTNSRNFTEIATPSVLLSLPADQVLSGLGGADADAESMTNQLYDTICAWEELIFLANKTQGIIAADAAFASYQYPMQTRQNIRLSRMFSGAFMFAAGSYVGIDYTETRAMVTGYPLEKSGSGTGIDGDDLNGLYGWGIAHEVGHNMDKIGYAEITNNIYSLVAQTADNGNMTGTSRLEGMYGDIFNKVALGKPGQAGNVFTQLGMYWQLHLAYDGAGNPLNGSGALDFYNAFFKAWKSGAYSDAPSKDDRIALIASEVTGKDLTEFFTRWGMQLSETTKSKLKTYGQEDREIWYLSDQSRRDRLNDEAAASLTASLTAAVKGTNQVNLAITVSGDADRVQGYEILRNGTPIAFLMGSGETSQTYTDTVGAANNMAFTYSVRVIDKLGYEADTAQANAVRISYNQVIDASLYTIARDEENGSIVITAKDGSVLTTSGLMISGSAVPSSGAYTVTISGSSYQDITAKSGNFTQNESQEDSVYLTYFNKPGADDTRIWMYDAEKVVITGIPETVALEEIHLLSYPGDNIAFTEGASIAVLEKAYTYEIDSNGTTKTIPAGTVIITGSYRGDPLYNSVRVRAQVQTMKPGSSEAPTVTERTLSGETLLLAEIPEDGAMSTISDGIFLFIPADQDAFKQVNEDHGDNHSAGNQVMIALQAQMWRAEDTTGTNSRMTSDTLFISVPRYDSMPGIVLEQDEE